MLTLQFTALAFVQLLVINTQSQISWNKEITFIYFLQIWRVDRAQNSQVNLDESENCSM